MPKRAAVLLDLGYVLFKLYPLLGRQHATADDVHAFAKACVDPSSEEPFRYYCYHCAPFGKTRQHPLTRQQIDFSQSSTYQAMTSLISDLEIKQGVAYRAGELSFSGWKVKRRAARETISTGRPLEADDLEPDLTQKMVDIKIGLDVAWLASKSLVERIIMVTGDTDLIPAMKFARREGVQVVLATFRGSNENRELHVHADISREIQYPPAST